jgi:predicted Zn-dependent peptidase
MEFNTSTLKNGLKVIMNRTPQHPTATISVFINTGSDWESPDVNGIAHFIEHLFFKGTKKRPNQRILAQELEKYGSKSNAFTAREITCYHIKTNSDYLNEVIEIMSDVLKNSLYRVEDIEMEKKVVINEIHQRNSNQSYLIAKDFYYNFFKGLPIAKPVAGKPEIIKKINRFMVLAFIYKYYRPENMVISVSGNFKSYKSLKYNLENHFGGNFHRRYRFESVQFKRTVEHLEKYKLKWSNVLDLVKIENIQPSINYHITPKIESEHTFVLMGFSGFKYTDPEKYKAQFLAMVLGGGMSSRLFETIRTKHGLVYSIKAYHQAHDYTGAFIIEYSCNHSLRIQLEIIRLIKQELDLLKNELISQKEYETSLEFMQNNIKLAQEDSYENCLHYGIQCLKNNINTQNKNKSKTPIKNYQEIVDEYKKISVEDLQTLANEIFNWNKLLITTLSPVKVFSENYKKIFFDMMDISKSTTKTSKKKTSSNKTSKTKTSKTKTSTMKKTSKKNIK